MADGVKDTASPGNWKTETDLSCVVDEACWMCSPGVSSHLKDRVNGGQGEGVEVDSAVGWRL